MKPCSAPASPAGVEAKLVLYCLICRKGSSGTPEFLMVMKHGSPRSRPRSSAPGRISTTPLCVQ